MKKFLLPIVLCSFVFSINANAQIQKGNVLVGADVANFKIGLEKDAGFNLTINPKAGWFIRDNFVLGAYVKLGVDKFNKSSPTVFTYGAGPFARYYINQADMNLLKHGRFFGEANAGIEGRNVSDGGGTTNGLGLGFGPGYAYFITQNIGFETLLTWNPIIGFGDEAFQSNLNLHFGFQIYLPGKSTLNRVKREENIQ